MGKTQHPDGPQSFREISVRIGAIIHGKFPGIPPQERDDIVQEVQLKLWKMMSGGRKIRNLKSYLWKMVYTTALDVIEGRQKEISLGAEVIGGLSQEKKLEKKEAWERVLKVIETLSPQRRLVMKLHLTGLNVRETAEFLNWNESRVNHLFYRAKKDLQDRLKQPRGKDAG